MLGSPHARSAPVDGPASATMVNPLAWPAIEAAARRGAPLVFVCSGNMVRSAFAELYGRHLDCPALLESCGTTYRNEALYPETAAALRARGVDEEALSAFRPTHVDDRADWRGDEVFLAMREHHLDALRDRSDAASGFSRSAFLLDRVEIADPVLEGASFEATFARVATCVDELVRRLREGAARA